MKDTISTRGSVTSRSATVLSDVGTTLSTPGGMSVRSTASRPKRVAFHGVSGAGFSTTVFPVARAGPSLFRVTSNGKFHGAMAATTTTGSRHTTRRLGAKKFVSGSLRSHAKVSIIAIGVLSASVSGHSSWAVYVTATGEPTSATSSARNASLSSSRAC